MVNFSFKKIVVVILSVFSFYGNSEINKCTQSLQNRGQYSKLLTELDHLHKECIEEGWEVFSETARTHAKDILHNIMLKFPDNGYSIYPTENREIVIDYSAGYGRALLIELNSSGGVAVFVTIDGNFPKFLLRKRERLKYLFFLVISAS